MSEDSNGGLGRFFSVFSGAGTATWGFSEMTQEFVIGSLFASSELAVILTSFSVLLFGGASVLGGLGLLGPAKQAACGLNDD